MATKDPDAASQEPSDVDDPGILSASSSAAMKLRKKQWLISQINSQKAHANAASSDFPVPEEKERQEEIIADLLEELQKKYIEKDKKELIMKRLQLGDYLLKELFEKPLEKGSNSSTQKSEKVEYIEELLQKQCNLVSDIMKTLKESEELRQKLDDIQKKNFELKAESRSVMKELKKKTDAKKIVHNQETRGLCQEIDLKMQTTAIIKNVLSGLIIGSGVNWAQDEQLQTLVFKLGETVE